MGWIYKITNSINDKVYIGQTHNSIQDRWNSHKYSSKESKMPLYQAMRKYGIENFQIESIEECPQEKLNEREIYWIEQYHSYGNGYNATRGGDGHWIYEEDTIKNLWDKGYNLRKICRELNIAIGTVKKILRDYPPFIEQREQRYIEASSDKSYESTPVNQYSLDGEYIETYPSLSEAERQTGTDKASISRVCKGKANYANGFQWKYKDDDRLVNKIKTNQISVLQIKNDRIVQQFESISEASRQTGFDKNMIRLVAQNGNEHKGYHWEYADKELSAYWKNYYDNLPPKTRKKSSQIYKRGADHYAAKAVVRINPDGQRTEFDTLTEAGKSLGNPNFRNSIANHCDQGTIYRGYYWEYRKE